MTKNSQSQTFNLRHFAVDRDTETLGALVVVELHVAVGFLDAAAAHVRRIGRHFDHPRRLKVRQLATILLTFFNRAYLNDHTIKRQFQLNFKLNASNWPRTN